MINKLILWVDDTRNPYNNEQYQTWFKTYIKENYIIAWVKNYEEFVNWLNISINDIKILWPTLICFDHDLGEDKTGLDCAKYLVQFCMDNNLEFPYYFSQSSNPVGKENIISYLNSYIKSLQ